MICLLRHLKEDRLSLMFTGIRTWWSRGEEENIPGVVYYHEHSFVKPDTRRYEGFLHNVRVDTAPKSLLEKGSATATRPGPEEQPYTWFERMGLVPIHPSRVRARQYYHPITDFAMYDYDKVSPEELELTARWMSKIMDFNMAVPVFVLCLSLALVVPFEQRFRLPILLAACGSGVIAEAVRSYMSAAKERQDLDDFVMAKEIWYIKNIETYQLGLARMAKGREQEFRDAAEAYSADMRIPLPEELQGALSVTE